MTFTSLEMTILKFHDFSRVSMTVRTLSGDPIDLHYDAYKVYSPKNIIEGRKIITVFKYNLCEKIKQIVNDEQYIHIMFYWHFLKRLLMNFLAR